MTKATPSLLMPRLVAILQKALAARCATTRWEFERIEYVDRHALPSDIKAQYEQLEAEGDALNTAKWEATSQEAAFTISSKIIALSDRIEALLAPFVKVGVQTVTLTGEDDFDLDLDAYVDNFDSLDFQYFDTGSIADLLSTAGFTIKILDTHGSALCTTPEGECFYMWEDYGDSDSSRHLGRALVGTFNLMHVAPTGGVSLTEAFDVYLTSTTTMDVHNWRYGDTLIPASVVQHFDTQVGGKRAVYYNPEEGVMSLRCTPDFYEKHPQYQDPSRPVGNTNRSGTRVLFSLEHAVDNVSFSFA